METLLVQSQGSPRDPKFSKQKIELDGKKVSFNEFFHKQGILTLEDDLVNSCHGNTELTLNLSREVQALADSGYKVVSVQQGGLYFAKPSIEAANMPTVPVISIPLNGGTYDGLDAFLAPQIPSGTATVGGVGIANYQTAANAASAILNGGFEGVFAYNPSEKLLKKLDELGVPIIPTSKVTNSKLQNLLAVGSSVSLAYLNSFDSLGSIGVFSPHKDTNPTAARDLMMRCNELNNSVYVRGDENVAFYAAKIIALNNDEVAQNLKSVALKKSESYQQRNITINSFTMGGK